MPNRKQHNRDFQAEYDIIRDKAGRLAQRNPCAYSQLAKYGKQSIQVRRDAQAAGVDIERRPNGWTMP